MRHCLAVLGVVAIVVSAIILATESHRFLTTSGGRPGKARKLRQPLPTTRPVVPKPRKNSASLLLEEQKREFEQKRRETEKLVQQQAEKIREAMLSSLSGLDAALEADVERRDRKIQELNETIRALDEVLARFRTSAASARARQKEAATEAGVPATWTNSLGTGMHFVYIPAGSFIMEAGPDAAKSVSDTSGHLVTITKGFYIGAHEVTQGQYKLLMGKNPSTFKQRGILPVENVSWDDAQEFCKRLSEREGKRYRLPTEAEWEYACRARALTAFSFGEALWVEWKSIPGRGFYAAYAGNPQDRPGRPPTRPVDRFSANAWGVHQMHGNVAEWCQDWFDPDYYDVSPQHDPTGPDHPPAGAQGREGDWRVVRGGGWYSSQFDCQSGYRSRGAEHRMALGDLKEDKVSRVLGVSRLDEASRLFGVSKRTVRRWCGSGRLKCGFRVVCEVAGPKARVVSTQRDSARATGTPLTAIRRLFREKRYGQARELIATTRASAMRAAKETGDSRALLDFNAIVWQECRRLLAKAKNEEFLGNARDAAVHWRYVLELAPKSRYEEEAKRHLREAAPDIRQE